MEATIEGLGVYGLGFRVCGLGFRGNIAIMETTIVQWGNIGITEKKMETSI